MTREPVLFRVDGTRASGWESMARCISFAYALQRRRRPCHFLSQIEPQTLVGAIKRGGNEWLDADAPAGSHEDLEEITQEIRRIRPAAVVIDSPSVGPDYLAELIPLGPLVVSLDSSASYRFPSQLVVNPTLNTPIADYEVCPGTQVLSGRRYAIVRSEVRRVRPIRAQEPPEPFRCILALADDPHNWTVRLAKLLLEMPKLGKLEILARPYHPLLPEWQALAEANKGKISVAIEPAEVSVRVSRSHFAICDGNSWAMEFACVGLPTLLIVQNESFWPTAQRLEEEGCATCLGWHEAVTDLAIRQAVDNLLSDPAERRLMARCGRTLIDGRGPDRLVTALEVLLHPSRHIDLREAA
jgi:spore coat polysaccharide biosynthesis predicted glycosyltransferase SpsG